MYLASTHLTSPGVFALPVTPRTARHPDSFAYPTRRTRIRIVCCALLSLKALPGRVRGKTVRAAKARSEANDTSRRSAFLATVSVNGSTLPAFAEAKSASPLELPKFGVGAWAWGDRLFWGYDEKQDPEIRAAFDVCAKKGVKLYDTAELYGPGRSEELLGRFIKESGLEDAVVATKFAPLPWKLSRSDVLAACQGSLERLGMSKIDLYQIHFPSPWKNEEFWDGLGDCYEKGLVRAVGVSNYGSEALRGVHAALKARGIPLASNQVQYSLVYRYPELNGMKDTCDELGIKLLAYSPLGLGALTGKFGEKLPEGPRRSLAEKWLADPAFADLLQEMRRIAKGGTASQVALAWCMAKGAIPIPGVRTVRQAADNVAAMNLMLSAREVEDLDLAASKVAPVLTPEINPMVRQSIDTKRVMFEA